MQPLFDTPFQSFFLCYSLDFSLSFVNCFLVFFWHQLLSNERRIWLSAMKRFRFCEALLLCFISLFSTLHMYFDEFKIEHVQHAVFRGNVCSPNTSTRHWSSSQAWCNFHVPISTRPHPPSTLKTKLGPFAHKNQRPHTTSPLMRIQTGWAMMLTTLL